MAFQYAGMMTVLSAEDLLFDREDIRRLLQACGAEATDSEIGAILKETSGYPLCAAILARHMAAGQPYGAELTAQAYGEVCLYFETAVYRRFDLPIRRFLLELSPFERFDLEFALHGQRRQQRRRAAGYAVAEHDPAAKPRYEKLPLLAAVPANSCSGSWT